MNLLQLVSLISRLSKGEDRTMANGSGDHFVFCVWLVYYKLHIIVHFHKLYLCYVLLITQFPISQLYGRKIKIGNFE